MSRQLWSEQVRITLWAWVATLSSTVAFGSLLYNRRYLVDAAGLLVVVMGVGALLRTRRAPSVVVLLVEVAVALELAVLAYGHGQVPSAYTLSTLRDRFADFFDSAQRFAAPLPVDSDTTMTMALIVVAIGIVVDLVGVSLRRVPLLGLLFLLIYMVPVAQLGGHVSMFSFVPGALGFVFFLAADERERLTHWGRQISTAGSLWDRPNEVDDGGLRRSRLRIGFGAVALAAVLPIVVPTFSPHLFGSGGSGGGSGDGSSGQVDVTNPVLDLRRNLGTVSNAVLLRVRTDDPDPSYFRLAALDVFTGDAWEVGPRPPDSAVSADSPLPPPPGQDSTVPQQGYGYSVAVTDDLATTWLPLVYSPTTINVSTSWLVDRAAMDARIGQEGATAAGTSYGFTAALAQPTTAQLEGSRAPGADVQQYLDLPVALPQVLIDQADTVTAGAPTAFDQALALQRWFRSGGGFTYSLADANDGNGLDAVSDFLGHTRTGYCEQFASAMALMARHLGIPSRVVVGFLRPEATADGTYEFRGKDMHAWPELYFAGVGWVRFEPTPSSVSGAAPDFGNQGANPTKTPNPSGSRETPTHGDLRIPSDLPTAPGSATVAGRSGGPWGTAGVVGLVVLGLAALAALPRLLRSGIARWRWRRVTDPASSAEAAWAELHEHVLDLRMDWADATTPRHIGRSIRSRLSGTGLDRSAPVDGPVDASVVAALNTLVLAVEQGRYARSVSRPDGLRDAETCVYKALASTRTQRTRWLATWFPASLLQSHSAWARSRARRPGGLLVSVED